MSELPQAVTTRYRVVGVLGRGGAGITHAAERLSDGAAVAIKELDVSRVGDWKRLELFEREARVLAGLSHPGIPRYLESIRADVDAKPRFYLVQERARGRTLAEHLDAGWRADEARVKHIGAELLRIVVYLQSLAPPVIHRDIKPQNVIMTDDGSVSLVDFGAVRDQLKADGDGSTVVGTYGYMAPEQFRGHALPATDLYGVGATLLFLLTRRAAADLPQKKLRIDFRQVVQVSPVLGEWLDRMIAPAPEDRFETAREALHALLHPTAREASAPRRRIALLAALGLLVLGGVAFIAWAERSRPGSTASGPASAGSPGTARTPAPLAASGPKPTRTLAGHWSAVFGVAWTSDGGRLVSGSFDQTAKLWDTKTGEVLKSFGGHGGKIGAVAVTPDDRLLVSAGGNTVRVWDLVTGQEVRALPPHPAQVTGVALSRDGKRVVASSADGTVRVSAIDTGETVHTLAHPKRVLSVAASERHVVTGCEDGVVRVFGLEDGREARALAGHTKSVGEVAVAPDGQTLASASDDGTVRIWILDPGKAMRTLEHGATEVWTLAFAQDGKTLATGTKDDVVRVWDVFTGKLVTTMAGGLGGVIGLAYSPDARRLAAGGGNNQLHVWSLGDPTWHPPIAQPVAVATPAIPATASEPERLTLEALHKIEAYSGRRAMLAEATALLQRAIVLDPKYARAHAVLARATYKLGFRHGREYDPASLTAAHVHTDRAIDIDPKLAEAYVYKGWIYLFQKNRDLARDMARKADALDAASPRVALLIGELAVDDRDYAEAMRRGRAVLERQEDPSLRAQGYGLLVDVYAALRDWEGADACHQSMINLEPDEAWHKGNYAAFLVRRRQTDRAIEMATSAIAQMSYPAAKTTLADAYAQRAQSLVEAGNLGAAGDAVKAAMSADANSGHAHLAAGLHHRAVALAERDVARMAQAEAAFRRALALEPRLDAAQRALAEHPALVERLRTAR